VVQQLARLNTETVREPQNRRQAGLPSGHARSGRCWLSGYPRRGLGRPARHLLDPPTDPHLDRARQILDDFAGFWTTEPEAAERRKLLAELFRTVWQKDGQIVAVKPQPPLAPYFTAIRDIQEAQAKDPKADRNYEVTKAGATGLEPATSGVTGR
jgi:hypothetical protein